jgi:cell division protein FtsB
MKIGPLQINLRRLGVFVAIGILLVLVMDFNSRMEELTRLQNQAATVRAEATSVMVTQFALLTQVAEATSQAAVEDYARNQAHLAQPGDTVIIPLPQPGATPLPTPTPALVYSNLSNWDVWMIFLFGR